MNVSFVEEEDIDANRLNNRSTFMITINTHTKPQTQGEFNIYKKSLRDAVYRILTRENIHKEVLYQIATSGSRGGSQFKLPGDNIQLVKKPVARFSIERGTKQKRIDSHILMDFEHRDKIQFNCKAFGELVDMELAEENENFERFSIRKEKGYGNLKWADPKVYCSVRLIGKIMAQEAENYIGKQFRDYKTQAQPLTPADEANERELRSLLRNDIRFGINVGVGTRSDRTSFTIASDNI